MAKVYLAGPITGCSYEGATDWRDYVADLLDEWGHQGVSPMRGKTYLANQESIRAMYQKETYPMSSIKGIYGRDIFDVAHCDVTLANLLGAEIVSIGTVMEIQRARDLGKYVLVVMEPDGVHNHPFVHEAASLVVHDLDTALDVLAHLLIPYKW